MAEDVNLNLYQRQIKSVHQLSFIHKNVDEQPWVCLYW